MWGRGNAWRFCRPILTLWRPFTSTGRSKRYMVCLKRNFCSTHDVNWKIWTIDYTCVRFMTISSTPPLIVYPASYSLSVAELWFSYIVNFSLCGYYSTFIIFPVSLFLCVFVCFVMEERAYQHLQLIWSMLKVIRFWFCVVLSALFWSGLSVMH